MFCLPSSSSFSSYVSLFPLISSFCLFAFLDSFDPHTYLHIYRSILLSQIEAYETIIFCSLPSLLSSIHPHFTLPASSLERSSSSLVHRSILRERERERHSLIIIVHLICLIFNFVSPFFSFPHPHSSISIILLPSPDRPLPDQGWVSSALFNTCHVGNTSRRENSVLKWTYSLCQLWSEREQSEV